MRYELYGVILPGGTNTFIKNFSSLKKALAESENINSNIYKTFCILEKMGKYTIPLMATSGYVGGPPLRSTCLVMPNPKYGNPIKNSEDGENFWKTW